MFETGKNKLFFILISTILFSPAYVEAKYIHEYLEPTEKLLMDKNYSQAHIKFNSLSPNILNRKVDMWSIALTHKKTVKWLKDINAMTVFLGDVNKHPYSYETSRKSIFIDDCDFDTCKYSLHTIKNGLPRTLPYSQGFIDYLNRKIQSSVKLFNNALHQINSYEQLAYEERQEIRRAKRQKIIDKKNNQLKQYELAQEKHNKEVNEIMLQNELRKKKQKISIKNEIKRLDSLSKKQGYNGFLKISLIRLIYESRKNSNLEFYLNKVIGCNHLQKKHCKNYSQIKAIQNLKEGVLYSFSEFRGGELLEFLILLETDSTKLFQDGQSLKNDFYLLNGTFSYKTILGTTKTIPSFREINLTK